MKHQRPFGLRLGPLFLEYDINYGVDNRTGWSVHWRGRVVAELTTLYQCGRQILLYAHLKKGVRDDTNH